MSTHGLPSRLFKEGTEPNGERVHSYADLSIIDDIRDSLPTAELEVLTSSQFGKLFDVPQEAAYSGKLIHFLLTRQLVVRKKHEIWVLFAGSPIRLSISEFEAVTGLLCSQLPKDKKKKAKRKVGPGKFWFNLFDRPDVTVEWVVNRLKKGLVEDKDTRLRYAALALVDGVLCPTSGNSKISPPHADMVEHFDKFLLHPWGSASFDLTLRSIKARGPAKLRKKSITVQGFPHALQLVLLKSVPTIKELHFPVEDEDGESDMEAPEPEIGRLWPLKLDIVWKVDAKSVCPVTPCIGGQPVDPHGPSSIWSDDEDDAGVDKIHECLRAHSKFSSSMFTGGLVPEDVLDVVNETSDNGSNDGHVPPPRKRQRNTGQNNIDAAHELPAKGKGMGVIDTVKQYVDMKVRRSENRVLRALAEVELKLTKAMEKKLSHPCPFKNCSHRQFENVNEGGEGVKEGQPASVAPNNLDKTSTADSPTWHSAKKRRKSKPAPSTAAATAYADNPLLPVNLQVSSNSYASKSMSAERVHFPGSPLSVHSTDIGIQPPAVQADQMRTEYDVPSTRTTEREGVEKSTDVAATQISPAPIPGDGVTLGQNSEQLMDGVVSEAAAAETAAKDLLEDVDNTNVKKSLDGVVSEVAVEVPREQVDITNIEQRGDGSSTEAAAEIPREEVDNTNIEQSGLQCSRAPNPIISNATTEAERNELDKIIRITSIAGNIAFGPTQTLTSGDVCDILELKSYLTPMVMDLIMNTIRRSWEGKSPSEHLPPIAFRDSSFLKSLLTHFHKFSKASEKGMYMFDDCLLADCPTDVHKMYVPTNFDSRHWVCLCLDLHEWTISVIDCFPSAYREAKMRTFVNPIAEMFPYLIRFATKKSGQKKLSCKPMVVQREKDIPAANLVRESGVMTAYLGEVHALGGTESCKLVTIRDVFAAARKYILGAYEAANGSL